MMLRDVQFKRNARVASIGSVRLLITAVIDCVLILSQRKARLEAKRAAS